MRRLLLCAAVALAACSAFTGDSSDPSPVDGGTPPDTDGGGGGVTDAAPDVAADAGLQPFDAGGAHVIFVTSAKIAGTDPNGVADALALCTKLALDALLPGTYVPLRVGFGRSDDSAFQGLPPGPWISTELKIVASDSLSPSAALLARVTTERGKAIPSADIVWTGAGGSDTCAGWTATGGNGRIGDANGSGTEWWNKGNGACEADAHVYCVQNK